MSTTTATGIWQNTRGWLAMLDVLLRLRSCSVTDREPVSRELRVS